MGDADFVIGYWFSERKEKSINFSEFISLCHWTNIVVKKLDFDNCHTEGKSPYNVILHKLTDVVVKSLDGCSESEELIDRVREFSRINDTAIFIDPLPSIEVLLNRRSQYEAIRNFIAESYPKHSRFFVPSFFEVISVDPVQTRRYMAKNGLRFPIVCKHIRSHGTSEAHQMCIVFNEKGLADLSPNCIAQNFINHDAKLYKIFVIGPYMHIVERPSIKDLMPRERATIFFDSQTVSKQDSSSFLTGKAGDSKIADVICPEIKHFIKDMQKYLDMQLIGVDIIVEKLTNRFGVIDVNVFPGYIGVPNLAYRLMDIVLASA